MNRTVARLAAPMFVVLGLSLAAAAPAAAQEIIVSHGSSLVGELKYGPDFTNFEYANPDAPTGGDVKFWAFGSYDTLNPFTLKGRPASGIGLIFDTLMVGSADEPSSHYGLIAETMELPLGTVKARIHRAHRLLKEKLTRQGLDWVPEGE